MQPGERKKKMNDEIRHSLRVVLVSICATLCMTSIAFAADKSIAEATAKPDKVAKRVWFGPAPSQIKKLYDIGLPKRIGLLSFNIYDTGSHEYTPLVDVWGHKIEKWGMNEFVSNVHASKFAEMGVPVIKQRFAEKGMEVLTPFEFLDTEEKITAYLSFELMKTGWQKAAEAQLEWLDRNPHASGAAYGFRMIPLHASFLQQEVMGQLNEFRKTLGLDALMVVTTHTGTSNRGSNLGAVTMQLVGPNPEPRPENEKHVKWWWPAILYPSANFGKGFKGAPFLTFETKKSPGWHSYEGFDVIIDAMSTRTLAELQKHYDKGAP